MVFKQTPTLFIAVVFLLGTACNNGPKVISSTTQGENPAKGTGIFTEGPPSISNESSNDSFSEDLHKVVVNEVLPTSKYVYLRVQEGNDEFWIATRKQEVEKGETYYYQGGLLKTNFESKEYNRVFDRVYLVSKLVSSNHANHGGLTKKGNDKNTSGSVNPSQSNDAPILAQKGSIKIADIVNNPQKYAGQTVQISGKCSKINANIMGRNWVHLQDGSKDDFDLVITTSSVVPEGAAVTMKATVVLDKDFGAGYKYDLILENGSIVP